MSLTAETTSSSDIPGKLENVREGFRAGVSAPLPLASSFGF